MTLLVINLHKLQTMDLLVKVPPILGSPIVEQYLLQGVQGIASQKLLLNKVPLETDLLFQWGKKKMLRKYGIPSSIGTALPLPVSVPPLSILFLSQGQGTMLSIPPRVK